LWPHATLASLALACSGGIDNPSDGDDDLGEVVEIERDT
jgi:hypothetical protein